MLTDNDLNRNLKSVMLSFVFETVESRYYCSLNDFD